MHLNPCVTDLLDRMESDVWLPQLPEEKFISSTTHSISALAYAEARRLSDPGLYEQFEAALAKLSPRRRYRKGVYALGHLAGNTKDPRCLALFLSQLDRKGLGNLELSAIIEVAAQAKVPEIAGRMERFLTVKNYNVLYAALQYCASIQHEASLGPICDLLDQDCFHLCHPMYAIFALEAIGHSDAIPALRRAVERHRHSKKGESRETAVYAASAIKKIQEAESGRGDGIAPVTPPTPPDMRVRIRRFQSDDGDRP